MLSIFARFNGLRAAQAVSLGALVFGSCWMGVSSVQAQNDGGAATTSNAITEAARRGAIRRQEDMQKIAKTLALGDRRHADRDYAGALELYREAFTTTPNFLAAQEIKGVAFQKYQETVQLHADELAREGRRDDAVQLMRTFFDDAKAAGLQPSEIEKRTMWLLEDLQDNETYEPGLSPGHIENVAEVKRLFVLADGYVMLGDFKKATESYMAVLGIDPYNKAARRGLEQVTKHMNNYYDAAFDHTRAEMLNQIAAQWESPVPRYGLDFTGLVDGQDGETTDEDSVLAKLNTLMVPSIAFEQTPLTEVLGFLNRRSKEIDVDEPVPAKKGVNFVLATEVDGSVPISMELRNVPLGTALTYITELANMSFRIDGYAVVIVPAGASTDNTLLTKRYRVPPTFIKSGAIEGGGGGDPFAGADPFAQEASLGGNATLQPRLTAEEFLKQNGIPFPDGASAQYLPETSTLIVRNTQANLDLIEVMIDNAFGSVARLLKISVKQIEITESDLKEVGFDWLLGQFNIPGSSSVFGSGGTDGTTSTPSPDIFRDYPFIPPGQPFPLGRNPVSSTQRGAADLRETLPGALLSERSPGIFAVGGAFTDPQFQMVVRALGQKKGTDLMSTGSVVTQPGQRAQVRVVREFIYPSEYDPPEVPDTVGQIPFGANAFIAADSNFAPIIPAHPAAFEMREVGSILEVEGTIGPDGYTVSLNLTPEVVRFDGFIDYGSDITQFESDAITGAPFIAQAVNNQILQPVFLVTRETTAVDIYDGETLAIGGLITDRFDKVSDGLPLLQEVPFLGRLFKTEIEDRSRIALMFFVTVSIIDPAGREVNQSTVELPDATVELGESAP